MNPVERDESADDDFYQIKAELARAPRPRPECRSNIVEFYRDRSVFITGASGFIGKVLIEKLLRACPDIRRIYVLIRPKRDKRPEERLAELLACPLFAGLRDQPGLTDRVVVVEGDVTQQNLGLSGQNLLRLTKEVSVIFHSAATVKFDEPLKQSVAINIAGTKNMIEFCRRCAQLAGLVHVSTAYANCDRDQVDEHVYPMKMDPEKLIQMADWLDLETMQELKRRLLGARPNTYTYTKALAEWLIVRSARDLPVVVCRPSIVCASQAEPFKGWIDNVNGPTGVILGAGKGLLRSMFAETECVADLVPVDKVINLVITLGWFAHINKNQKHLNEAAESFTESLLSGGPSSVAGSSSASTNGGDDLPAAAFELEQRAAVAARQLGNEAAKRLGERQERGPSTSTSEQAPRQVLANGNKKTRGPHHLRQHRLAAANGSSSLASSSLSGSSSPSLSGDEEEERALVAEAASLADGNEQAPFATVNHHNHHHGLQSQHHHKHHEHHHHQLLQQQQHDEGYGSRSDYAHSISSSDSSSTSAGQKRRQRRSNQAAGEKPVIRISSICETRQRQQETVGEVGISQEHGVSLVAGAADRHPTSKQLQLLDENNDQGLRPNATSSGGLNNSELEEKLKQFRQLKRDELIAKELPEELADVPVFHCTSGAENAITWGRIQLLVITALTIFPSISTYRYPCGSFTNNKLLYDFYRLTLHYLPGLIADSLTRLVGGKPVIVKIFKKFDQAALVLRAFTSKQWDFKCDNRAYLMNQLMSEEDKRLFNCDIKSLDWEEFMTDYVIGVKKFLLKEPISNLEQARRNLNFVYYRNLSLQVLFFSTVTYYMASTFGLLTATATATATLV